MIPNGYRIVITAKAVLKLPHILKNMYYDHGFDELLDKPIKTKLGKRSIRKMIDNYLNGSKINLPYGWLWWHQDEEKIFVATSSAINTDDLLNTLEEIFDKLLMMGCIKEYKIMRKRGTKVVTYESTGKLECPWE